RARRQLFPYTTLFRSPRGVATQEVGERSAMCDASQTPRIAEALSVSRSSPRKPNSSEKLHDASSVATACLISHVTGLHGESQASPVGGGTQATLDRCS